MIHGSSDSQLLEIWHKHLGHLHNHGIHQLTKMFTDINIGPPRLSVNNCVSCLQGSQYQQISQIARIPASAKLEIVHIDVKGPCDLDVNGFRYWANFMYEKTRFHRWYGKVTFLRLS